MYIKVLYDFSLLERTERFKIISLVFELIVASTISFFHLILTHILPTNPKPCGWTTHFLPWLSLRLTLAAQRPKGVHIP